MTHKEALELAEKRQGLDKFALADMEKEIDELVECLYSDIEPYVEFTLSIETLKKDLKVALIEAYKRGMEATAKIYQS